MTDHISNITDEERAALNNLSDDERLNLYNKCVKEQKFDLGAFTSFFTSVISADFVGLARFFAQGYKNEGCAVFLTQAQKYKQEENTKKANGTWGMPTGKNPPA